MVTTLATILGMCTHKPVRTHPLTSRYTNPYVHLMAVRLTTSRAGALRPAPGLRCSTSILLLAPRLCPRVQESGVHWTPAVHALCRGSFCGHVYWE